MEPVIAVEELTKVFQTRREGAVTAVDRISFEVQRGEVFGFLGPNGAGKTTTIRMLLGLMRPTSGQAAVLGHRLPDEAKALRTLTGYMSQVFTLYNELTPVENMRFYGRVYGLTGEALARREQDIIQMAGLSGHEHERTASLSGGWRQRLALGCAIIHDPELIFLDEPTAGVDPVSRRDFWELIYELADNGTTVFVTTHYMDEAELCQRLALISGGRLVALGSPEEFKAQQMGGDVLEIECDQPEAAMRVLRETDRSILATRDLSFYGAQIHVVVSDAASAEVTIEGLLAEAGIGVRSVRRIEPSLEDVFIAKLRPPTDAEHGLSPSQPAGGGGA